MSAAEKSTERQGAAHTPGPWSIHVRGPLTVLMDANEERAICDFGSFDRHDPDERLIIAAPELLAALQEAQRLLDTLVRPDPNESTLHVFARAVEAETKARAAIAKATGSSTLTKGERQ